MPSRTLILSLALMVSSAFGGLTIRLVHLGLPPVVVKYGGSMLWALLIYWTVSALVPSWRLCHAALFTAGITTAVECFKLCHAPSLDAFRLTLPGMLLLGRFFSVWDLLAYWLVILSGTLIDMRIRSSPR